MTLWGRIQAFRHRHETAELALVFIAGFLADVFTLGRIDNARMLTKQGVFLILLALLLALEERRAVRRDLPEWLDKAMAFSETAIHFLLGGLLSLITLFFFRSASGLGAFAFLAVVFVVLVANDFPRFRALGPVVRFALFSFCLTSYLAYLLPVLMGFMYPGLFVVAACLASLGLFLLVKVVQRWAGRGKHVLHRVVLPAAAMQLGLVGLYYAKVIPPVPLAVQYLGVFHKVQRDGKGGIELLHERPDWRFWEHGDQEFFARPGDRIYCFARVFAPTQFQQTILVRWSYDDPKLGWRDSDALPMTISGGRDEGFRAWSYKANYQPGHWRVTLETDDGREMGRIRFTVVPDETTGERDFKIQRG